MVIYINTLETILSLINAKGISEKQFLLDVGLNSTAMSDWKKGRNKSYLKHIDKIADYFGVSIDFLLGKSSNPSIVAEPATKLDKQFNEIDFALAGELRDLTDAEKQDILDYIRFKKTQKVHQKEGK